MKTITSPGVRITIAACLAGVTLAGCGNTAHTEQASFGWQGKRLEVVNDNANMPVRVRSGKPGEVLVEVSTTTVGKSATTPAWALNGDALELGTPCGQGYVGVCEGSYTVTVPSGTAVKLNGSDVPVK